MEGGGSDTPEQQAAASANEPTRRAGSEPTAPAPTPEQPETPAEAAPREEVPSETKVSDVVAGEADAPQPAAPPPARDNRRGWLIAGVVVLAAAVVGVILGSSLGGRQGGPLGGPAGGGGRPTIVVGSVVAAPSPSVVASPSPPTAQVGGATASAVPGATAYVVQPGDTLQGIAEEQYGDAGLWPRIYQANRQAIGEDPDNLVAGTTLQIPPK